MTLKTALNGVVSELEQTGALVTALQDVLISKNLLTEAEIQNLFLKTLQKQKERLEYVSLAISELQD